MSHLEGELFDWRKFPRAEVPCPLCGAAEAKLYEKYGEEGQYSLVKCRDCRLVRQSPVFEYNDDFLKWAYHSYGEDFQKRSDDAEATMRATVAKDRGYFQFKQDLCERFVEARPYTLLDVGCAAGQFIYACRKTECRVAGVEVSKPQAEFARERFGLDVFNGTVEALLETQRRFDVVHCSHTLEHLPDPKTTLQNFVRLLNPGGIVFIEVPNLVSLNNYVKHLKSNWGLMKNTWGKGDFPEHLVEFTPATIRRLFREVGLDMLYFQVHSKSVLNRSAARARLDQAFNRVVPIGNNMICIGRPRRA